MWMLQVAYVGAVATGFAEPVRDRLAKVATIHCLEEADVLVRLPELDVLVSMVFSRAMAERAERLKLLQVPGAGLDRIDRRALPTGVALANVFGHEAGIAEYAIGAMITVSREILRLDAALRRGDWQCQLAFGSSGHPVWRELAGKSLGILGYGHIGRAIARRARAFDMRVDAVTRNPASARSDGLASLRGMNALDQLLRGSDYLAVAQPLVPETRGLIGARELAFLPKGAVLVNVARGDIVDEDALYAALESGHLGGAAIDVWYRYPTAHGPTLPARWPFHTLPNVLMSPHVSGWTDGMRRARAELIAGNIERTARGEPPLNQVA
jgi:phosphoglycerate dehydrogenase-like enzyme